MPTKVRQHGTRVHTCADGAERIAAFRSIVDRHSYAKIDGVAVDLFSASAVVQVHDALRPENWAKYADMDVMTMVNFALKMLAK